MSATSQLEVYKIILPSKTTFGDLVQGKFYAEKSPQQTDFTKFKKLYKAFLEKLIKNNVWEYKDKKKGLTVFLEKGDSINQVIKAHPDNYTIEGYLDGGRYDMIRKMAAMSDTTQRRRTISATDIVAARYYFYLYTPFDISVGLLFLEKKNDDQIRDAVKAYFEELFKWKNKCQVQAYFSKKEIEEFKKNSVVDTLYSVDYICPEVGLDEQEELEAQAYEVLVQIKKVGNAVAYENVDQLVEATKDLKISFWGKTLDFLDFKTRKGIMKNTATKKQSTFDFDKGVSIHPYIEVDEEMLEDGILNRDKIYKFCTLLLKEIHDDVYNLK